ncbi:serine hydrolase domain-containing protein [Citromicrobium sp. JLT1363]|uniref:serine hydrolase domain-containing protein n=1 Tax=Citromicrobium sp. JLT1363 TaxID=517722 RepID=UPI000225DFCD|nr:serine hydrolase domain-containing protein [Citromicrobium sp. JLT1363]
MLRAVLASALLLTLAGCSTPAVQDRPDAYDRLFAALDQTAFAGAVAASQAANDFYNTDFRGKAVPAHASSNMDAWPWASVTKQVVAVLVMQQVEDGAISLDAPAATYLPAFGAETAAPTIRQLLQHRSGLRNPDDSPVDATGFPSFYSDGPTGIDWCLAERSAPTDEWRYNNCDYIVLGAILERVTGQPIEALLAQRIGDPAQWRDTAFLRKESARTFEGRDATYATRIARYGSSAALVGPLEDMLRFDRALLSGKLLSAEAREELWSGDPALGYMALGQWVFDAPLDGCDAPVRVVERRGAIGKYQVRNIILPESGFMVALVIDQEDFDFGEIWSGSGAMHDALAAVACR